MSCIHRPDHVAVQKRRIHRLVLNPETNAGRCLAAALARGHRAVSASTNLRVILLTAAKRAADGVEPKIISPLESPLAKDARTSVRKPNRR